MKRAACAAILLGCTPASTGMPGVQADTGSDATTAAPSSSSESSSSDGDAGSSSGSSSSSSDGGYSLSQVNDDTSDGPKSTLFGRISLPDGRPNASVPIALCDSYGCKGGQTEADGTFVIENNLSGSYAFLITGEEAELGNRAFTLVALELDGTADREYDAVALDYTAMAPMPEAREEIEVAPSLLLTLRASDIEADFTVPQELDNIGGLLAPPEHRMETDGLPPIVAMWHIAPYKSWAPDGLPMRIRDDFELGDGETYELWEMDYDMHRWTSLGQHTVEDGFIADPDLRLTLLTTVVLTEPG